MITEQALKSVLDARREELHRIDGVIGSGIWLSGETLEIQLFVADEEDVEAAKREAGTLLGSLPFDVQVSPIPSAYADALPRVADRESDERSEEGDRELSSSESPVVSGRDANQPERPTDVQILNYVRSKYGLDFETAVEEAFNSDSWVFAARVRESFVREMAERDV